MNQAMEYDQFIQSKTIVVEDAGFDVAEEDIHPLLFPFQRAAVIWALKKGRCALFEDCGLGKAQPIDEPVLTPSGWKPMGELRVGSEVIGDDGLPAKVVAIHPQGVRPIRLVRFSDGVSVRCDEDHLWAVRSDNHHKRGEPWKVMSASELASGGLRYDRKDDLGTYSWRIPLCKPVQFAPADPLPIDPYVLGVLLGDGSFTSVSVILTNPDIEIAERVRSRLPEGLRLVTMPKRNHCPQYRVSVEKCHRSPFVAALRELGLKGLYAWEKHVPPQYLTSSPEDRLELLRGLLDTDGEAAESHVQFCTTSPQLAEAVTEIVQSLGGTARTNTKRPKYTYKGEVREGRLAYLVQVRLPGDMQPFALPRKADCYAARPRLDPSRKIVAIEDAGTAECMCITVDNQSSLYVTKGYAVTHNSFQQIEWARHVQRHTGGIVLILAPLAVSQQTITEALKLGVTIRYAKVAADITGSGIWVTNYERLEAFLGIIPDIVGMVGDESGILKSYMGKTRLLLTSAFRNTPYRLCCTATPAPNDHMELGNHAEFLGVMPANEMLSRWFINDTMHFGQYKLKGHAVGPFWEWVSSWAVCAGTPADLGFPDDRFILPPLRIHEHLVDADLAIGAEDGNLFRQVELNATSVHREMRLTTQARSEVVRDLVRSNAEPWIAWCHTNYEADALKALIPEAVEVRGSETLEAKEAKLIAFSERRERILISKPSICGYGLNLQHCAHVAFVGLSFSFESYYQALRRVYRFGQEREVNAHLVMAETEAPVWQVVRRKAEAHEAMQRGMYRAANAISGRGRLNLRSDYGDREIRIPAWLEVA